MGILPRALPRPYASLRHPYRIIPPGRCANVQRLGFPLTVYESQASVGLVEFRGVERIDAPIGVERGARIAHGRERVGVS